MYRPRVVPCLLLKGEGLVKTVNFSNPRYIGDPMNAVRIFNERFADEVIFLDIVASGEGRCIFPDLVRQIGEECSSPFAVGGGIQNIDQIKSLLQAGAEKVVLNSAAFDNPALVTEASQIFGSQSIVVSIDVVRNEDESYNVVTRSGSDKTGVDPVEQVRLMEASGAGEIMLTAIDREGGMEGYDIELCDMVSKAVDIPVIAQGGASSLEDVKEVFAKTEIMAAAAGSMFVYHGPLRGVLINFPTQEELLALAIEA